MNVNPELGVPQENPFIQHKDLVVNRIVDASQDLELITEPDNIPAEELIKREIEIQLRRSKFSGFQVPRLCGDAFLGGLGELVPSDPGLEFGYIEPSESADLNDEEKNELRRNYYSRSAVLEFHKRIFRAFGILGENEGFESLFNRPGFVVLEDEDYAQTVKRIEENPGTMFVSMVDNGPGSFYNLPTNLKGVLAKVTLTSQAGDDETKISDKIKRKEIVPITTFYLPETGNHS